MRKGNVPKLGAFPFFIKTSAMSDIKYFTEEGLERLKNELHEMKTTGRRKMAKAISDAREKGDLSENAEYDAAKEAQGLFEAKIAGLENDLANARVIDESKMDTSRALILSTVRVMNLKVNKEFTFTLVSQNEADLKAKKLSVDSPIGQGLLGKEVGDVAEVETPAGVIKFEILEITRS